MIQEKHLHEACCDLVRDVARISGKVQLRVTGTSMVPALWPGDVITVRRCEPSAIRLHSIVMFQHKGRVVVHRLIRRTANQMIARGDALFSQDEPICPSDVIGRVESVIRNNRSIDPTGSLLGRGVAFVIRHSEFCSRLFLQVSFKMSRYASRRD